MKKIMIDESHRLPSFLKYTSVFSCGCAYMNDSWGSEEQCPKVCPEHGTKREFTSTSLVAGERPENAKTEKSPLRVGKETIARLRD
ncbi:hypothetical protein D8X80_15310 [Vibrio parahaemolyticus]|nr:hypothetical protein [Vibrio parahaemolyticus]MBT0091645.1 hypothetical protein [Vibrio alginolyticus]OQT73495.1 hypothetical protein EM98_023685 [Vibrio parahaemolyticus]